MSEFEFLGPYKLDKLIGRGGMGSVYEATHAASGDRVAVKLIAQHIADDMRFRRRFDAEIETLRRLRHPGIVRLIGYGEESGRLFYAMELVHGESLQQRIRDVKRMNWLPSVDIAIQITSALKHAHDMGVIHRDLKPANLLLTENNEVKIVDFGIAKLFGFGDQTLVGSVLGTADYMAPEQADDGPITPRTDLYALGSVMYAMMAGRSPFAGKKMSQVVDALKRDRAVPLELINPDIPHEVVEIVHQLLEKVPTDRPPTAISVNKRLKATRAGLQRGRTVSVQNEATQSQPPRDGDSDDHSSTSQSFLTDGLPKDEIHAETGCSSAREETGSSELSPSSDSNDDFLSHGDNRATAATGDPNAVGSHGPSKGESSRERQDLPTRFQIVEDHDVDRGYSHGGAVKPAGHHWLQVASFTVMLAVLAGGIYLFIRATRIPSADSLYETLQEAENKNELTLNEALIDRFLVHYPDDRHAPEVQRWKHQADLDRTLKRLSAQAWRLGGVENLSPAAQKFIETMELRASSPPLAREHLQAWQDLFTEKGMAKKDLAPDLEQADPLIGMDHLTQLVREELQQLTDHDEARVKTDSNLENLRSSIRASNNMDATGRERALRGLIKLYKNDPWARPAVEEANAMLQSPADVDDRIDPSLPDAR